MKRLFFAILLPDEIKDDLCDLRINSFDINWISWENYHLSLQFLGDGFSGSDTENIIHKIHTLRMKKIDLILSSVGFFGSEKNPRMLWAGVEKNGDLLDLREQIVSSLRHTYPHVEIKKFIPHVSLGRPSGMSFEEVGTFLQSFSLYKSETIKIDSFYLMESVLTKNGARYNILEEFELFEF